MCEKILLIDGHSILNRAFYGLPDLTSPEGLHTGAVYGFLNILFRVLEEEKPEYLAVAFDRSECIRFTRDISTILPLRICRSLRICMMPF